VCDRGNSLLFSPVSLWEVSIKSGLGRADFSADAASLYNGLLRAGYEELPVTARHVLLVNSLPALHKDPFDRLLLAQAACEGLRLLTADKAISRYPGAPLFVG
jgi:PIN domain nuclease of toxin-antitoxin system